jgi:SCP1.201-like deaminase
MPGHVDDAADALAAAADEVPVEAATSADQQLAAMVQSLQWVGGAEGERLTQLALVMQEEGRRIAAELATLRQQLQAAAASRRASARTPPPPTSPNPTAQTSVSPSEPTVQARDGSRYPAAAGWCADDLPRRVQEGRRGEKTYGYANGSLTPFVSGRDGTWSPDIKQRLVGLGIARERTAEILMSHVELKVATMMTIRGVRDVDLVINHAPCGVRAGQPVGCDDVLESYLPKGYSLTVHGTTQDGDPFSRTYRGRA